MEDSDYSGVIGFLASSFVFLFGHATRKILF
jgi:hypothetical protein